MRHLFLINPAAGKRDRTSELAEQIAKTCSSWDVDFKIKVSEKPGDITAWARKAASKGEEVRIYACGGDGTLNEAVAGAAGYDNAAVTHFPCGSGNDFVRMFGNAEAFFDLENFKDPAEDTFDLISCNGDFALNICSVGLDARIGTEVAAYKRLPLVSGSAAYILSTGVNLVKGISEHYVVEVNGETIDARQTLVCVANGRFYGGGFNPVPEADPTDGKLDVLLVKEVSLLQVAKVIGQYKAGRYADYPDLIRHITTDSICIRCDRATPVNLDGELRRAKTVNLRVAEEKIRFFYPKCVSWQKAAVTV